MTKRHATSRRPNLSKLGLRELQALFAEVIGESTRCPNRVFLERKIRARWTEHDATAAAAATEPANDDRASAGEDSVGAARTVETPEPPAVPPMPATVEHPEVARAARPGDGQRAPRGRFSSMTIEELQGKYAEVVGRPTGSSHRGYLQWKIREAEKGRIAVGPRESRARDAGPADVKILPLRLEADALNAMDKAWRSRGIKTRMEFLRRALGHFLTHIGAADAAAKVHARLTDSPAGFGFGEGI